MRLFGVPYFATMIENKRAVYFVATEEHICPQSSNYFELSMGDFIDTYLLATTTQGNLYTKTILGKLKNSRHAHIEIEYRDIEVVKQYKNWDTFRSVSYVKVQIMFK